MTRFSHSREACPRPDRGAGIQVNQSRRAGSDGLGDFLRTQQLYYGNNLPPHKNQLSPSSPAIKIRGKSIQIL